ncbi:MAG: hypothetical protein MK135_02275 [Polyangiaceae bacterium]|nr:hypothetical protein [Polyangiaceae bacterium]
MIDEALRFDVRIRERMIQRGLVSQDEIDARLANLKDLESESELIDVDPPAAEPVAVEPEGETA